MMLYHLDSPVIFPNWSEIYVIITVSTMLCEDARKVKLRFFFITQYFYSLIKFYHDYDRRMVEPWGSTESTILTFLTIMFYITPYFLFYLGLIFRYRGYTDDILTVGRFVTYSYNLISLYFD
jgi:hypothetical protein